MPGLPCTRNTHHAYPKPPILRQKDHTDVCEFFELVIELVRSGTDEEDTPEGVELCSLCSLLDTLHRLARLSMAVM